MVWVGITRNGVIFGPHVVRGRLDTREYIRIIRYNVIQREFPRYGINQEMNREFLQKAFDGMVNRARRCIEVNGGSFSNE